MKHECVEGACICLTENICCFDCDMQGECSEPICELDDCELYRGKELGNESED